ncbi:MAG: NAD(P)/FAD-dependent oxidoreductase, partial [Gemmataceae bacterium]
MSGGGSRVVVIGGGVVGVACAHYLREAGCAVAVIEKNTIGSACSHANCGYVCPSHVLPLAGPGVIWKTLGTFLKKDSPLAVRFRLDPALWSWFFRFARRCNHHSMMEAGKGISAILNSSRKLFGELFESRQVEAGWQEQGMLFVFRTPAEFEHYSHVNDLLRDSFDMPARRVESGELTAMDPALKPGLAGAWYYPKDAHLRPDQLMTSWSKLLRNKGVDIRENTEFVGFDRREGRIQSVQTSQGNIQADQVVVATGAWTPLQDREIGLRLPIQPGKGYSITMARPGLCPRYPMIFEEDRVA